MTKQSAQQNSAILDAYDFSKFQVVADIGGGQGSTLVAVLERYPSLRVLFDRPSVVGEPAAFDASGVRARCAVVGGDMLDALPPDADLYMIKRVLMLCGDAEAVRVLENCVAHVRSGAGACGRDGHAPSGRARTGDNVRHPHAARQQGRAYSHGIRISRTSMASQAFSASANV